MSPATTTDRKVVADGVVTLESVSKTYGRGGAAVEALTDVSIAVARGEFVCFVGPSGCGKSSLLSLVAGLDQPTSGEVRTADRQIAFMFQEPALFPWLTAAANIELALRARKLPKGERQTRVAELLEMVGLASFAAARPHQLSGGMRQRVALARALAQDADVLLMDEPFGALDAITRNLLHGELERLVAETGLTVLFVTHNVGEAVRLGDRVIVLSGRPGRIVAEHTVDLPRPRRTESSQFAGLTAAITAGLQGTHDGA
ncbi:ABC transporter ATP-binding protein [Mycobacterium sp.]|uniref:ABC transporter ATP-binding protein n=1 Tax=Mycobacterium sp. TaxID=1785 RepID=UPI0025FD754A|nr:ABC transporter ATP-binding protein [Mycobacterium sp.]